MIGTLVRFNVSLEKLLILLTKKGRVVPVSKEKKNGMKVKEKIYIHTYNAYIFTVSGS